MNVLHFDRCWYALQVRPRREFLAARILHNKGFEEFVPTYKTSKQWSDRQKKVELPLFPGYVFCRFDSQVRAPILTTPGVIRVVGMNAAIPDSEIQAIQTIASRRVPASPHPYLNIGTRVEVVAGPLAGVKGILVSYKSEYRLVLTVSLVQNSVSVEVDLGDAIAVSPDDLNPECKMQTRNAGSLTKLDSSLDARLLAIRQGGIYADAS